MYQILRSVLRKQPAPPQELIVPSMGPKSITHTVYKASNHSSATTTPIVKTEIMDSDSSPISTPAPTAPTKALKAGKRDFDKQKSKVFELIDKFRELGIQEDISLPQLVVVGDQSSGKSSLLEALTKLPFPVASTICTRFATHIVFRRSAPTDPKRIVVSITPSQDVDEDERAILKEFGHTVDDLTQDVFAAVLDKASEAMGLPKAGELVSFNARFSDSVLKIELSGPDYDHFSVVDIPGLFQSETQYQTVEDALIVEGVVKKYINDSRTIILAVASSLNETANQKVFRLATEADPKGIRTLGVLTKPDVLQKGDEARVIEVARNNVTVLNHGWFVVRNRSTEEVNQGVSIEQRNNNEQSFFNKVPWNLLQKSRVGVQSLERFLRALLDDHVRKEFPNLCKELDNKIQSAERELEVLGPRRDTPDEQRRTLLKLANEFQNISNNALMGYYKSEILGQDEMKIRMHVQNANDFFSQRVVNEGHEIQFDDINDGTDVEEALEDETSIYSAIREQYRRSRGPELPGMVNPIIVQNLFKWQSSKWEDFARHHVATIRTKVETFNSVLLNHVCGNDSAMEGRIKSKLRTTIQAAYNAADREISSILKDEREGILLTLDNYYSEQLEQSRKERTSTNIARNTRKVLAASTTTTTTISSPSKNQTVTPFAILPPTIPAEATDEERTDLLQAYLEHMTFTLLHNTPTTTTNDIQSITDIHDILKSYYTVARKRFIDNIAAQVIERHFLQYTAGPIRCFSPEWVGGLAVEELAGIAGEEWVKSTRRSMLAGKLGKWREARGLVDRGF